MIRIGLLILGFVTSLNCSFGQWTEVGTNPISASPIGYYPINHLGNTPYITACESSTGYKVTVYNLISNIWTPVGSVGISDSLCIATDIEFDGTNVYVAYQDADNPFSGNAASVKMFNGSTWSYVGSQFADSSAVYLELEMDGSTPYIAYYETIDTSTSGVSVKKFNGTNWEYVGTPCIKNTTYNYRHSFAINNSIPYLAFEDDSVGLVSCKKFNGTSWVYHGQPGFSVDGIGGNRIDLGFNNDTAYVAYAQRIPPDLLQKITVSKFNGSSWVSVGQERFSHGDANSVTLDFILNNPAVTFEDDSTSWYASLMMYEGGSWVNVDLPNEINQVCGKPHLDVINNTPFIAVTSPAGSKVFTHPEIVSVEDETDMDLHIFPNPVNEFLNINILNSIENINNISITTSLGQVIYSKNGNKDQSVLIDCSSFLPGSYFVRLITNNSVITKQIIIQ